VRWRQHALRTDARGITRRRGHRARASLLGVWRSTRAGTLRRAVEVTDAPRDADVAALEEAIDDHNLERTGRRDYRPLGVFERDPQSGETVAGLVGFTWGGWLEVRFVWVRPDQRGRRLGRRLVETAEAEARARGCRHAWLDSYTFQAPGMYEKLGYRVFGRLQGYPDRADRVFLTREL
jgi:ribosomal protein S18 acetylase RimI-like enzyme